MLFFEFNCRQTRARYKYDGKEQRQPQTVPRHGQAKRRNQGSQIKRITGRGVRPGLREPLIFRQVSGGPGP